MRFSKKLRAGNPAMFCFPIPGKFLHYLAKRCTFEKRKTGAARSRRPRGFHRCNTHLPPAAFSHCCWIIQSLLPKVTLNLAAAALPAAEQILVEVHVEVVPKLKLHLSESSCPLVSNQAFRSGSVMASNCSCERTLIRPSAPPTLAAGLLGPVR